MKESPRDVNHRIASRVRELRATQGLSLDALASKTGVSRSMISVVERGESSPTAVVLDKLAAGLGVTMASLFEAATGAATAANGPVARLKDQPQWKDPASGYVRRNVSPSDVRQPMQIVEVLFPPCARVAFESGTRDTRVYQQIWLLEGAMEITVGTARHQLHEGDCLAMQLDSPTMFRNPTRKPARYAVVIATEGTSRRYVDYQLRVAKVESGYGKSAVSQSSVPRIEIRTGGLSGPEIAEFLREHLRSLAEVSPPESRHALNLDELRKPDITFWSVWEGREVVGCGALKELDPQHGEIKSMRTAAAHLRKGVGTAVLEQIIAEAKRRGYRRLSLETGAMPYFTPAHRLYRKFGFTNCPPFADYVEDPNSVFMTKEL